jgi:hypothetical protein
MLTYCVFMTHNINTNCFKVTISITYIYYLVITLYLTVLRVI